MTARTSRSRGRSGPWPARSSATVFTFLRGLYFRGKLEYARAFGRAPAGLRGVENITPTRGLLPPETRVTLEWLREFSGGDIRGGAPAFVELLRRPRASSSTRLKVLIHLALLVVDGIGYTPISRTGAMLFFQLMSRRHEHASTVLTSNKSFERWGDFFGGHGRGRDRSLCTTATS